jgi:hypothetical protein
LRVISLEAGDLRRAAVRIIFFGVLIWYCWCKGRAPNGSAMITKISMRGISGDMAMNCLFLLGTWIAVSLRSFRATVSRMEMISVQQDVVGYIFRILNRASILIG